MAALILVAADLAVQLAQALAVPVVPVALALMAIPEVAVVLVLVVMPETVVTAHQQPACLVVQQDKPTAVQLVAEGQARLIQLAVVAA